MIDRRNEVSWTVPGFKQRSSDYGIYAGGQKSDDKSDSTLEPKAASDELEKKSQK
jgi:hypothetical protein